MSSFCRYCIFSVSVILLLGSVFLVVAKERNFSEAQNEAEKSDLFSLCGFRQENGLYFLEAKCVLQEKLPPLSVQEVVDLLREDIIGFDNEYQPFSSEFSYFWAHPLFGKERNSVLNNSSESQQQLLQWAQEGKEISFSKKDLARYWTQYVNFYVSHRDLSKLRPCSLKNYTLALDHVDKKTLKIWESWNANKELAQIREYCTGIGEQNFLFYGGVCGMTSQMFRISLLHPGIEVIKRYPHEEWFVQYYGEEIWGDDAAIYEMSKQFEIKNISEQEIYFRTKWKDQQSFLVAISPRNQQWIQIRKEPTGARSLTITRTLYQHRSPQESFFKHPLFASSRREENIFMSEQRFDSLYHKKNYEFR